MTISHISRGGTRAGVLSATLGRYTGIMDRVAGHASRRWFDVVFNLVVDDQAAQIAATERLRRRRGRKGENRSEQLMCATRRGYLRANSSLN